MEVAPKSRIAATAEAGDVASEWVDLPGHERKFHQAWLITNTRFTDDAITYGSCMGINMISWNYPHGKSLRDRVNESGLHPLTCLTTLTAHEKELLLERRIILCKEICHRPLLLNEIGIRNHSRIDQILNEANQVCLEFQPQ